MHAVLGFISVAGGAAVRLHRIFGGTNIIMTANSVPALSIGGFYSRFAGTRIFPVSDDKELQETVAMHFATQ